jgi:hypothetical protein
MQLTKGLELQAVHRGTLPGGSSVFGRDSDCLCLGASWGFFSAARDVSLSGLALRGTSRRRCASYVRSVTLRSSYWRSSAVRLDGLGFPEADLLCDVDAY